MTTFGEDYPKMQELVRGHLQNYRDIGPVGAFGAMMIEDLLSRAAEAVAKQDIAAMIRCYEEMKEVK